MNTTKTALCLCAICAGFAASADENYVSKVWVPDNGDGTYTNPVINADYSDPDAICVDGDYWLTSSSFTNQPGLPILHSRDMVNWEIVNYALPVNYPTEYYDNAHHGDGVWAPAIRYHNGEYFIYWGDPDYGIYMVKTKDPRGEWEKPVLVLEGKGIIDTCPLWDEDGKAYLVNGWAKSRSGLNAVLTVTEMSPDGTKLIGEPVLVYDGLPDGNHTIEGPKFYKRNGWYYIMAPAGSVKTGWQVAMRSRSPYGPYEQRIVMAQGDTDVNGPHQGAWVETPEGEDWFLHFQDKGVIGRVTHLQPMQWVEDWPVIGEDKDGDGCGQPVMKYRKPKTSAKVTIHTPQESDEFDSTTLGKQWEWFANYKRPYGFPRPDGTYRLYGWTMTPEFVNMREIPNILTQKFPNENFTATTKVTVSGTVDGQQSGLIIMGLDYARLSVEKVGNNFEVKLIECNKADKGGAEKVVSDVVTLPASRIHGEGNRASYDIDLWLRVNVKEVKKDKKDIKADDLYTTNEVCTFYYSTDGKKYTKIGKEFKAREGHWIGARVGCFSVQPKGPNRGWMDINWFRIEK